MNLLKDLAWLRKQRLKDESAKAQLRKRSSDSKSRPTVEEMKDAKTNQSDMDKE